MAIRSCRDGRTADFLAGKRVRDFLGIEHQAAKAIAKLQAVERLVELRNPPSNRFEALGGDRVKSYSIRINDRWRLCFSWHPPETVGDDLLRRGEPFDIEIVDYH